MSPPPARALASLIAALVGLAGGEAAAQPPTPAAPAPLREFTTDRPDTTESPFTVDAGHLQTETTLFGFTRSHRDGQGVRTDTYEVGTTELRIGLTPSIEANLFFQPYGRVVSSDGSPDSEGPGDVTLRAKINLWGDDGVKEKGQTAFGLIPFVDIPTQPKNQVGDDRIGGGVILPLDVSLGGRFELGLNAGVDARRDDPARGYEAQVLLSVSLGCDWTEKFGTYYEIATVVNRRDPAGQIVNLDTGVTYKLGENLQLDAGVTLGATRAADQFSTFIGVSKRF